MKCHIPLYRMLLNGVKTKLVHVKEPLMVLCFFLLDFTLFSILISINSFRSSTTVPLGWNVIYAVMFSYRGKLLSTMLWKQWNTKRAGRSLVTLQLYVQTYSTVLTPFLHLKIKQTHGMCFSTTEESQTIKKATKPRDVYRDAVLSRELELSVLHLSIWPRQEESHLSSAALSSWLPSALSSAKLETQQNVPKCENTAKKHWALRLQFGGLVKFSCRHKGPKHL